MRSQCVDVEVWSFFRASHKEKLSLFHPSQGGYLHDTFPEREQFLNKGAYKSGFLKPRREHDCGCFMLQVIKMIRHQVVFVEERLDHNSRPIANDIQNQQTHQEALEDARQNEIEAISYCRLENVVKIPDLLLVYSRNAQFLDVGKDTRT